MNPLDTDEIFNFSGRNPNISLRRGRDGPVWRVSFEVEEGVALDFTHAETAGMNLDFAAQVMDRNEKIEKPEKPKGGPISKNAGMKCQEPEANQFAIAQGFVDFKTMIYAQCGIESRAELDHDKDAAKTYAKLKSRYFRWVAD